MIQPFKILLNILERVSALAFGKFMMWKNLVNLRDNLALEPVGGAATHTHTMFLIVFSSLLFLSYNYLKPMNWRSSSTGGWASNSSCRGMFTSSTMSMPPWNPGEGAMILRMPTPLNFSSIYFWVVKLLVWAENYMKTDWNLSDVVEPWSASNSFWQAIVLPAPVMPVKKTGWKNFMFHSIMLLKDTVSLVGTTRSN